MDVWLVARADTGSARTAGTGAPRERTPKYAEAACAGAGAKRAKQLAQATIFLI
jgi:hypothetical protein